METPATPIVEQQQPVPENWKDAQALVTQVLMGHATLATDVDLLPSVGNGLVMQWPGDDAPAFLVHIRPCARLRVENRNGTIVIHRDAQEAQP